MAQTAISSFEGVGKKVEGKMGTVLNQVDAEKLGQALGEAKDEARLRAHELSEQAKMAMEKVNRSVKEHPLYYIGTAALVGLAAGYLLSRSSRH
ncbi:MAG: YqjD family protein [Bdellovibrionales bacterium]